MTFQELLEEIQQLKIEEKRSSSEDYLEVVVAKPAFDALLRILKTYFGEPLKPQGKHPSGEANRQAKAHGGVRGDQTLYFLKDGLQESLALLWPWGGGERVTVKIARKARPLQENGWGCLLGKLFRPK